MCSIDHLIDYIMEYMDFDVRTYKEEWESGKYQHICDCPTYPQINAYCNAIRELNSLDKAYDEITPESLLNTEE